MVGKLNGASVGLISHSFGSRANLNRPTVGILRPRENSCRARTSASCVRRYFAHLTQCQELPRSCSHGSCMRLGSPVRSRASKARWPAPALRD